MRHTACFTVSVYHIWSRHALFFLRFFWDTPESVRRWWYALGQATFPNAKRLYVNCDAGGSNGWRVHLWKYELALLAEEIGLEIHVSHFPPGTSKWNKIEHRLFCYISRNRAGKPLIDIRTVVNLIGSTTTKNGLKVRCVVDYNQYPTGIKISEKQMACIDIQYPDYDNSWNYIIYGFKKCI
ncbi:MAG: ISAzo13 family transposase [Oscillibacter sp.]|nr:ISAzo13 family transposase [Oscillospiraceae bacterium]MBR0280330.1 ISAzo13 family transposase [Oscillibacter sp.]